MSTVALASNATDSQALESVERRHAERAAGLALRASTLLATVRTGGGWEPARDELVAWCHARVLAPLAAEEAVLYPAARRREELVALVRALAHEHALLDHLVAQVRDAADGPAALTHAGAAQVLYESHVAKVDELLLPALALDHGTSVAELLAAADAACGGPEVWRGASPGRRADPSWRLRPPTPTPEESEMGTEVHAARRRPHQGDGPLDLHGLADALLTEARQLRAGRSARTLTPGGGAPLKQSLLALTAGQRLQDHLAPGPTTLLGVRGTAVLAHDRSATTLTEGVWAPCPTGLHSLEAVSDAVVLITVGTTVPEAGDTVP